MKVYLDDERTTPNGSHRGTCCIGAMEALHEQFEAAD